MRAILETDRLLLREMTLDDLDFVAEMLAHPEVMRYYPKTYDREESEGWLRRQLARYARDGHGLWLVEAKDGARPVGQVGLLTQIIDGVAEPEIGYLIHRPYWRMGLASEAAAGVRDHAFGALDRPRVISLIRPENVPSQGVARRLGMEIEKSTVFAGYDHHVFALARPLSS
jgi:RimJ/RimL family protein N-acetyltransferase